MKTIITKKNTIVGYSKFTPYNGMSKPNNFDIQQAKKTIAQRKKFLDSLLDKDKDIIVYGNRSYKKKNYWRKLAIVAEISLQKLEEWKEVDRRGVVTYFFTIRASLANKQFADATGACTQDEKGKSRTIHDTRATAETRGKNRAISDLFAFGEVSAEELYDSSKINISKSTAIPSKVSEADMRQSLSIIKKLKTVLPGSAENLLNKNIHKMQNPQHVETTIRKIIAFEMSELNQQGFVNTNTMKNLAKSMFNTTKFNNLSIDQIVELLEAVQNMM